MSDRAVVLSQGLQPWNCSKKGKDYELLVRQCNIKSWLFSFFVEYNIFISRSIVYSYMKGAVLCQNEYIQTGYRSRKQQELL